ncbi:NAD dependent epimerase/dehydratase family protein (plasmid) [Legionella adelaidensis]|uniref:NAD dependent epimerase/dehydratase family protein n=1 Tax=Legionella adelaidensis TaxID=45056 RepID=A0A0W0R5D9_9GAMM|nr:NAD-dependent epimerase/dehydratase family protein [Legionella adelaidensis]KTC66308.1 NAD dependent epimerase/dehydratase family protein [Legionella adelaidensis]VEH84904.1 NAD dependent epimerase/dehydratase family protein [Legionella adelaidensis]
MAKYIITGGCGFIGSHLTKKLLDSGHEVIVIDDLSNGKKRFSQAEYVIESIEFFSKIRKFFIDCDACFHLAAIPTVEISFEDWMPVHRVNLQGSLNVFRAAMEAGNIPVIYASSCGVYGDTTALPLREDLFINPLSSYGCDKYSAELNAFFLNRIYGLPSIGLRFFNVYGPGQPPNSPYSGVITRFITQMLKEEPFIIYGDGEQTRDFVFVQDIVNSLLHAIKIVEDKAEVINICTGIPTTINQLASKIAELTHKKNKTQWDPPRVFDVRNSWGSTEKMKKKGFKTEILLDQGLRETIHFFQHEK